MAKRIVIALGGNALGKNLEEQMQAVKTTASAIADLIEDGHEVVIAHGNGPQVGMIQNAFAAYHKQQAKSDIMPLSMCVAMSQGYIGYDLQNMIGEELDRRGLGIHCATVLTQVAVDPADPAFQHPTKPIGAFMTEEEAKKLAAEKGIDVAEDAGRGWRQVVASPRPKDRHGSRAYERKARCYRCRRRRYPGCVGRQVSPQGRARRHRQGLRLRVHGRAA
jgi:carbamate kinase